MLFPIRSGEERTDKHVRIYRGVAIKNWEEAEKLATEELETSKNDQRERNEDSRDLTKRMK